MNPNHIDELAPAPYNPRRISEESAGGLRRAMCRFGDISGITYNARTRRLVCGHQRVDQLRGLGGRLVSDGGLAIELPDTGQRWPVRVVDWTDAEEKAANVTANNQYVAGEFTPDLQPLLGEVATVLGFDALDELCLSPLMGEAKSSDLPDIEDEDDPEKQQIAFILTDEQAAFVRTAVDKVLADGGWEGNRNGYAIAKVCREWLRNES